MTLRAVGGVGVMPRMARGSSTPAANGILTVFNIPHGLGTTPTYASVTAGNVLSSALFHVSKTSTNVVVTFLSAPLTGTLSLDWIAFA